MYGSHRDLLLIGAGIGIALILSFLLQKRIENGRFLSRKVLHFISIALCAYAPMSQIPRTWLQIIVLCAAIFLWLLVRFFNFFDINESRKSYGIFLFTIPLLMMLLVEEDSLLIAISMGVLALSDPIAAIVGKRWKSKVWAFSPEQKTMLGSFAFLVSSIALLSIILCANGKDCLHLLPGIAIISLAGSLSEAVGQKGWDNVFIPLSVWLLAPLMLSHESILPISFALIAGLFMVWSIHKNLLQFEAAFLAAMIGIYIGLKMGLLWIVPLAVFFLSSALISRIFPAVVRSDAKYGKARDYIQVWSNGGIYVLIAWIFSIGNLSEELTMILMMSSMSVATSDTWSSEIGTYFRGKTIDILQWRPLPPGVSGGISLQGTLAGLTGAVLMGAIAWWIVPGNSFCIFFWVAVSGFTGMLLDSVLGSWLQVKYRNENGQIGDTGIHIVKGHERINNDAVNFISNLITIMLLWFVI